MGGRELPPGKPPLTLFSGNVHEDGCGQLCGGSQQVADGADQTPRTPGGTRRALAGWGGLGRNPGWQQRGTMGAQRQGCSHGGTKDTTDTTPPPCPAHPSALDGEDHPFCSHQLFKNLLSGRSGSEKARRVSPTARWASSPPSHSWWPQPLGSRARWASSDPVPRAQLSHPPSSSMGAPLRPGAEPFVPSRGPGAARRLNALWWVSVFSPPGPVGP